MRNTRPSSVRILQRRADEFLGLFLYSNAVLERKSSKTPSISTSLWVVTSAQGHWWFAGRHSSEITSIKTDARLRHMLHTALPTYCSFSCSHRQGYSSDLFQRSYNIIQSTGEQVIKTLILSHHFRLSTDDSLFLTNINRIKSLQMLRWIVV